MDDLHEIVNDSRAAIVLHINDPMCCQNTDIANSDFQFRASTNSQMRWLIY